MCTTTLLPRTVRNFAIALLAGPTLLLAFVPSLTAQISPMGTWDFVLSGHERGVAQITFLPDGTLTGVAVYSFKGSIFIRTNGSSVRSTNLYGAATITGNWLYDRTNRISGFMNLLSPVAPGQTNELTSGLSFHGKVRPTRLTLLAFGSSGTITLKGIPFVDYDVVDIGGATSFLGTARVRTLSYPILEVFRLTTEGPNLYSVEGGGPGYTYTGTLLVSNQRFAAFFQDRGLGPGTSGARVAAFAGTFDPTRRRGTLIGTDGINTGIHYRISPSGP